MIKFEICFHLLTKPLILTWMFPSLFAFSCEHPSGINPTNAFCSMFPDVCAARRSFTSRWKKELLSNIWIWNSFPVLRVNHTRRSQWESKTRNDSIPGRWKCLAPTSLSFIKVLFSIQTSSFYFKVLFEQRLRKADCMVQIIFVRSKISSASLQTRLSKALPLMFR